MVGTVWSNLRSRECMTMVNDKEIMQILHINPELRSDADRKLLAGVGLALDAVSTTAIIDAGQETLSSTGNADASLDDRKLEATPVLHGLPTTDSSDDIDPISRHVHGPPYGDPFSPHLSQPSVHLTARGNDAILLMGHDPSFGASSFPMDAPATKGIPRIAHPASSEDDFKQREASGGRQRRPRQHRSYNPVESSSQDNADTAGKGTRSKQNGTSHRHQERTCEGKRIPEGFVIASDDPKEKYVRCLICAKSITPDAAVRHGRTCKAKQLGITIQCPLCGTRLISNRNDSLDRHEKNAICYQRQVANLRAGLMRNGEPLGGPSNHLSTFDASGETSPTSSPEPCN